MNCGRSHALELLLESLPEAGALVDTVTLDEFFAEPIIPLAVIADEYGVVTGPVETEEPVEGLVVEEPAHKSKKKHK